MGNYAETLWAIKSDRMHKLLTDLRGITGVKTAFAFGETHHATVNDKQISIHELREKLMQIGHKDVFVEKIEPTIEDCFMKLQE